jgi:hypothetical protein
VPLSIDIRTIARVQVVAWEDGEWGVVWETRDGRRGSERIGKRSDAEAIVLAVIGGTSTSLREWLRHRAVPP